MHFEAKRGGLSQFAAIFSSPRQQCFGMAVTGVIYGTSQGTDFNSFVIDELVKSGDTIGTTGHALTKCIAHV